MADMNLILQLRDIVAARECSLLLDPEDAGLTLGGLLERYLRHAPIDRLLAEGRITRSSADSLYAIQDLVYVSDDAGRLMDMFDGVAFATMPDAPHRPGRCSHSSRGSSGRAGDRAAGH